MKKFKKLFAITFVFSMMIALVTGCGISSSQSTKYLIATDTTFAPFEYEDNGQMVGIDMDLLAAIAKDQGFEYEVKAQGFNAAITSLESKQVDAVIAGMSITDERAKKYDFSTAYYEAGVTMAVKRTTENISRLEDLNGQSVAVKIGTQGAAFAESIQDKYNFTVKTFEDSASMYDEVIAGGSIACFEDYPVVSFAITQGLDLMTVGEQENTSSYGFAVYKGENSELLKMFNQGLENIIANGTYQEIIDKYTSNSGSINETATSQTGLFSMFKEYGRPLLAGLSITMQLTIIGIILASIIGVICALINVSKNKPLKMISSIYINIIRGTPFLVQAYIIYYGIPMALGIRMNELTAGILAISLNAGAYMAEIMRGGIESVDHGQMEAARSLGLPYPKAMVKVILPQAIRTMTPSLINQFIITLKDTSILSVIGICELTMAGKLIIAKTYESMTMWTLVALFYFIVIYAITKVSRYIERKTAYGK